MSQLHSQSETSINPAKFHRKISELIQKAVEENVNDSRVFKMKFDTLYLLFADQLSPGELVTTILIEYDDQGRIESAKLINEDDEDNYNYYYNYDGNQTRFSLLDFFIVENGIETYDGYQLHNYDQNNTLIASKEFSKEGDLIYGDSLNITYNGNNQITGHGTYVYQEGAWHLRRGTYDIQYNGDLITSYYAVVGELTDEGKDTLITYMYTDVVFNKNDPSFLFRDIFELFEIDSAGVDDFFLSREDAIQYFQDRPIQYNKYRIDGVSHPDTLIETSIFTETDHVETIIKDQQGDEVYNIHYYFDNEERLNGLIYIIGGDTTNHLTITYNEHDRVQTITSENSIQVYVEDNIYKTNVIGNLIEYRQDIEIDQVNEFSTILRFGYRTTASSKNISTTFLNVYPNPADHYIQIDIPVKGSSTYDLSIFDISGKNVLYGSVSVVNGKLNLNVDNLVPGVYHLTLDSGSHRWMSRFVKN